MSIPPLKIVNLDLGSICLFPEKCWSLDDFFFFSESWRKYPYEFKRRYCQLNEVGTSRLTESRCFLLKYDHRICAWFEFQLYLGAYKRCFIFGQFNKLIGQAELSEPALANEICKFLLDEAFGELSSDVACILTNCDWVKKYRSSSKKIMVPVRAHGGMFRFVVAEMALVERSVWKKLSARHGRQLGPSSPKDTGDII